ncbi:MULTISPECIES: AMP-binding protein [unclassified Methanoregula]|uniref:AMP-binding protein n=1 Tax=unclassified Methanoregula TaxID=2649730 RepID=UPI0009C5BFB2|nr:MULTISPECIES: AMP-binding protein [unclassified Methanoregula]OPX63121.1 MAG: 3-hydroxypropionyl-coenzyme A synthetase [Methanoregula sp. PtaB.Bin085]OPY36322.1 MAG: 3-hydroxypropionyl-coenzyme A synthetase [Methanoregula sp. PtaU1.Bin006]
MVFTADQPSLYDLLFENGQDPDTPAIESPGSLPLSFGGLRDQAAGTIRFLNGLGFSTSSRVAVVTPDHPVTGVLILSVMTGCTCAPLNPRYTAEEYERSFRQLRIDAVIVEEHDNRAARTAAARCGLPVIGMIPDGNRAGTFVLRPDFPGTGNAIFGSGSDTLILLQTSGTTSTTRIVPLTHRLICRVAQRVCGTFAFTPRDRCLHIAPYYHTMGIMGSFIAPLCAGGTVICPKDFIPSDLPPLLKEFRPTFYAAGPAMHAAILKVLKTIPPAELQGHSLRHIRSSSASLPGTVREELERVLGVPVIESYGMSEVGGTISTNLPPGKQGSVGRPVIDELAIIDENGNTLPPLQEGEIAVRGPCVFSGYDDSSPEENASLFTNGWFRTGDTGFLDDEGYLHLTGRKKELINKGGEKISPAEVDAALLKHPAVADALCFRIDDPSLGEEIGALVVVQGPAPALTAGELRGYLAGQLSPHKIPLKFFFVDTIPRTPQGKPLRSAATRMYS